MQKPELLAPAGSEECLYAAIENGADAVYFGIAGSGNFNARIRAKNIPLDRLGNTVSLLHDRGVKAYLTLNTLAFADELGQIETLLAEFDASEVDAVLIQDLGIARLAHSRFPNLEIHASTQMSLSSAAAMNLAAKFGVKRVVLPRELSLEQIRILKRETDLQLEAFVHGALCISYSGQCFTSLMLGGRSANRGTCAQPCRMPYTLLDDGGELNTGRQIFSTTDLAALPLLKQMFQAGVSSFKIEGRLKPPEYVAEVTRIYRNAIDAIVAENAEKPNIDEAMENLSLTFSRGFSCGWLEGVNPRKLVPGNVVAHRGISIGTVIEVRRDAAVVRLTAPVKRGDGVLFENEYEPEKSQGGSVYEIFFRRESVKQVEAGNKVLLTFANDSIDADYVREGQDVRKTSDPLRQKEIRKTLGLKRGAKKTPLNISVRAAVGEKMSITASIVDGVTVKIESELPLEEARKHPLTPEVLQEQFNRLGETRFELANLAANLDGKAMIPLSVLGQLRRQIIEKLDAIQPTEIPKMEHVYGKSLVELRSEDAKRIVEQSEPGVIPHVLFRDLRYFEDGIMLQKCIDVGCRSFYAELDGYSEMDRAAKSIREIGAEYVAVAPRILKPSEHKFLDRIAKSSPDAVLVRNLGALSFFIDRGIACIADFSLNIVNDLAFWQLLDLVDTKLLRMTLGYDLEVDRLDSLLEMIPATKIEFTVFGRAPLFTMEHCLWKANQVQPDAKCERICKTQTLKIRDRYGAIHTVRSDIHCRNIVENSTPFTPPEQLGAWIMKGLRHLRIEWDSRLGFPTPVDAVRGLNGTANIQ